MNFMTKSIIPCFLLTAVSLCIIIDPAFSATWKAGAASVAITPTEPMWTGGYGGRQVPAVGKVHDLHVKALALEDPSGQKFVAITADLIGYPRDFTDTIAKDIEKKWKIPRKSMIFNASHTHCGPEIYWYPEKTIFVDYIPDDYFAKIGPYKKWLHGKFVEAIDEALKNLTPANITFSSANPVPFAVSRRFPDGKGGVIYRSSPSSYYTQGPRDDISPVLKATSPDGRVIGILFGYACHPITLNLDQFCADYPGFAQQYIEDSFPGSVALFMQGCHGELVPNARMQVEYAMGHGKAIADAVKKAAEGPQVVLSGPIKTAYKEINLNFAPIPDKKGLEEQLAKGNPTDQVKAGFLLEKMKKGEKIDMTLSAPLQAISFGRELLLLGFFGDTVADYSVNTKKEFSDRAKFVWASGANNFCGVYVPTLKILREGGYEGGDRLRSTPYAGPFAEDIEDLVMAGIREAVNAVTR